MARRPGGPIQYRQLWSTLDGNFTRDSALADITRIGQLPDGPEKTGEMNNVLASIRQGVAFDENYWRAALDRLRLSKEHVAGGTKVVLDVVGSAIAQSLQNGQRLKNQRQFTP